MDDRSHWSFWKWSIVERSCWAVEVEGHESGDASHTPRLVQWSSETNCQHPGYDHPIDATMPDHSDCKGVCATLGDTPTDAEIAVDNVWSHGPLMSQETCRAAAYGASYSRGQGDKIFCINVQTYCKEDKHSKPREE